MWEAIMDEDSCLDIPKQRLSLAIWDHLLLLLVVLRRLARSPYHLIVLLTQLKFPLLGSF